MTTLCNACEVLLLEIRSEIRKLQDGASENPLFNFWTYDIPLERAAKAWAVQTMYDAKAWNHDLEDDLEAFETLRDNLDLEDENIAQPYYKTQIVTLRQLRSQCVICIDRDAAEYGPESSEGSGAFDYREQPMRISASIYLSYGKIHLTFTNGMTHIHGINVWLKVLHKHPGILTS